MDISELTIKIIFLCFPGIICYFLYNSLVGKKTESDLETALSIFVFSVLSYLVAGVFLSIIRKMVSSDDFFLSVNNFDLFLNKSASLSYTELFNASIASIFVSYGMAVIYNRKSVNLIAKLMKVSNRSGDEDVWHFFHNADKAEMNDGWIFVRDHKAQLVYYGYISKWSETDEERELVISSVSVFTNDSAKKLYEMDHIYISRAKDDLTIEIPSLPEVINTTQIQESAKEKENDEKGKTG